MFRMWSASVSTPYTPAMSDGVFKSTFCLTMSVIRKGRSTVVKMCLSFHPVTVLFLYLGGLLVGTDKGRVATSWWFGLWPARRVPFELQ